MKNAAFNVSKAISTAPPINIRLNMPSMGVNNAPRSISIVPTIRPPSDPARRPAKAPPRGVGASDMPSYNAGKDVSYHVEMRQQ